MALNINGTTGISGVDGSASAPAVTGTDSNTGINFGSDTVNINTGGSTRATVDSSGNLGIGSTSPTDYDNAADNLVVKGTGNTGITIATTNTASNTSLAFSDGTGDADSKFRGSVQYIHNGDVMRFLTASAERMRLRTSTGGLMIAEDGTNRIGEPKLHIKHGGASQNLASFYFDSADDRAALLIRHQRASGSTFASMIAFLDSSGNVVGAINSNGNNTTNFVTSSDYRLKENNVAISDGITRLKTLKPYRFNFKDTPAITVDGFFAHEVTAVPEAITGTKDEIENVFYRDDDEIPEGKNVGDVKETVPKYQGIDHGKLVPLLTAALQEAIAKIEVLETKVAALEAG